MISFFVDGDPVPKGRPRMGKNTKGDRVVYTPAKTAQWEKIVKQIAFYSTRGSVRVPRAHGQQAPTTPPTQRVGDWREPRADPMEICLDFLIRHPGELKQDTPPPMKHDIDNLAKAVMDALNGTLYKDDRQITDLHARKSWGGDQPGVHIELRCRKTGSNEPLSE